MLLLIGWLFMLPAAQVHVTLLVGYEQLIQLNWVFVAQYASKTSGDNSYSTVFTFNIVVDYCKVDPSKRKIIPLFFSC